jgi:hypothetical protein
MVKALDGHGRRRLPEALTIRNTPTPRSSGLRVPSADTTIEVIMSALPPLDREQLMGALARAAEERQASAQRRLLGQSPRPGPAAPAPGAVPGTPAETFPATLDDDGYPAWLVPLVGSDASVSLFAVRALDVGAALRIAGAPAGGIAPVALAPSGLLSETVDARPGVLQAWLGFPAGGWAAVVHEGFPLVEDPTEALSAAGREALSCSMNIEGDTHLRYAVDGRTEFFVPEPVSACPLSELPERMRPAAEAAGVTGVTGVTGRVDDDRRVRASENFRVLGEMAALLFSVDALRHRPLFGATAF